LTSWAMEGESLEAPIKGKADPTLFQVLRCTWEGGVASFSWESYHEGGLRAQRRSEKMPVCITS
jgi:hypothetical protein